MKLTKLNCLSLGIAMVSAALAKPSDISIQTYPNATPKLVPLVSSLASISEALFPVTTKVLSNLKPSIAGSRDVAQATSSRNITATADKPMLQPGDVFGLITISDDHRANGETVVIYADGALGINEPSAPGYLFEAILFPEYKLLIAPEPLAAVKINEKGVFYLNSSLFNPSPIFDAKGWDLRIAGGNPVVCPSWNSVIVLAKHNEDTPCEDAISVGLGIVPITVDYI